ncbi:hypothetical protein WP12_17185 [Sphingomonas sp. SRS2]|nr:hypothetical protein WP12_17185 [Sphingomonas sp. SRS2]
MGAVRRFTSAMWGMLAVMLAAGPANATIDPAHQFIVNGGFEQTTNGLGQLRRNTNVVGWTSQYDSGGNYGYTYVLNTSTASTTGSPGEARLKLWGPGNGANNGLAASPTGGNFIGSDGAYHMGKLTQAIAGLIIGQTYQLTFNFAGAQEKGYNGASSDSWYFGFQNQGLNAQTAVLNNANHGFTGWYSQTYNFVATQTSDTLYFLAQGTPAGQPPFSLLDSVSLTGAYGTVSAAPDPATWMTLLLGFGIIGMSLRRRRTRAAMLSAV